MFLTEFLPAQPSLLWQYALQMGVRHAIVKAAPELTGLPAPWDRDALRTVYQRFSSAGLVVHGLEGDQFDMSRIKTGLPGRDEDLERYCSMLRNMGELGIQLLCYNFMPVTGWFRTRGDVKGRGGAHLSEFKASELAETTASTPALEVEQLWDNYRYFIQAVMPSAESAGVRMALHPDDPPLPMLCGVPRIFGTLDAFDRAYALAPSPNNGVTFCRANFKLMGADLSPAIRHFAGQGRLMFLHLREVEGTAEHFRETFHDEGAAGLVETLRACQSAGFTGPVRADHVPTLAGEANDVPGYGTLGRLFANGYILGLMDALGIAREGPRLQAETVPDCDRELETTGVEK